VYKKRHAIDCGNNFQLPYLYKYASVMPLRYVTATNMMQYAIAMYKYDPAAGRKLTWVFLLLN